MDNKLKILLEACGLCDTEAESISYEAQRAEYPGLKIEPKFEFHGDNLPVIIFTIKSDGSEEAERSLSELLRQLAER